MAEQTKLFNAVGLAMRAGKCASGAVAVEKLLQKGRVKLLILDSSASDLMKKQYRDAANHHGLPLMEMEGAGAAIGKAERKVLAITDENFIKLITGAMASEEATTGVNVHGK